MLKNVPEKKRVCKGINEKESAQCNDVLKKSQAPLWIGCNNQDRWFHKKSVRSIDLTDWSGEELKYMDFFSVMFV